MKVSINQIVCPCNGFGVSPLLKGSVIYSDVNTYGVILCLDFSESTTLYCYIAIHEYVKCTKNVHNSYIDNIGIPKHEKHLRLLFSDTKLFITFEL